jgi:hypothetical protein
MRSHGKKFPFLEHDEIIISIYCRFGRIKNTLIGFPFSQILPQREPDTDAPLMTAISLREPRDVTSGIM